MADAKREELREAGIKRLEQFKGRRRRAGQGANGSVASTQGSPAPSVASSSGASPLPPPGFARRTLLAHASLSPKRVGAAISTVSRQDDSGVPPAVYPPEVAHQGNADSPPYTQSESTAQPPQTPESSPEKAARVAAMKKAAQRGHHRTPSKAGSS
eukprot:CAMPEP_0206144514 /NCGR_PEP_ID=MMETSP1473-20131121/24322_1 /ASSEMBLY_ACC=CAM_ASM_001109 /TAXON_ID=1461547 /ORGANISM="Stichococcus sp, Strain RCC1054" /LENGTH=155 /DNA_ID=CAMNT_0053540353 /DNA_START=257 /DNA_END=720 /DNA_ORIENTATION=+